MATTQRSWGEEGLEILLLTNAGARNPHFKGSTDVMRFATSGFPSKIHHAHHLKTLTLNQLGSGAR
jgi:hypothetical protein